MRVFSKLISITLIIPSGVVTDLNPVFVRQKMLKAIVFISEISLPNVLY